MPTHEATGPILTHQQGRVGVLGIKGALALPIQKELSSATGHQCEVFQMLWIRGEKSAKEVKTTPNL